MVDNNERMAVAKLMRWFADEGRWGEFVEYCHKAGPTRMADLIDPDCEDGRYEGLRTVRPVDRDALLALADEMDHPIKQAVWNQTAGVRREHIMAEYARRIREALGLFGARELTHERPDSWERLEEDAANLDEMPCDYSAKDLVRRAKALADEMDVDAGCHEYVDDRDVYGYARRIREACGEQAS